MKANAGLIAGCAFAKDVLTSFLDPIKQVMEAECRDYVDDITIIARGHEARYTVPFFHKQLGLVKEWLTQNMVLNEKKNKFMRTTANSRNNGIPGIPRITSCTMQGLGSVPQEQ